MFISLHHKYTKKIMNEKNKKNSLKLDNYEPQKTTAYSNAFADFLGGKEAVKKINIYGHRIIFCMVEMLKTIQVFKPKYEDIQAQMRDELILDYEKGKITTIREIEKADIEKRRLLEAGKKLAIIEEKYFADNFSMLQFVITTKALNDNGNIKVKSNDLFRKQLDVLKKLGDHEVESNDKKEILSSNFIVNPIFDKGSSYIRFYISKETAEMLINNVNGYSNVHRTIVFENSSEVPLNFFLYLKRKFGKTGGGTIKIEKLVSDQMLGQHYNKPSLLEPFLERLRDSLNETSSESFGFSIKADKTVSFELYATRNTIGIEVKDENSYKCKNALKHIKKTRKISEQQFGMIKRKFDQYGYQRMSIVTSSKGKEVRGLIGDEYFKWFIGKCTDNDLL